MPKKKKINPQSRIEIEKENSNGNLHFHTSGSPY